MTGDKVGAGARPLDLVGLLLRPRVVGSGSRLRGARLPAVRLDHAEGVGNGRESEASWKRRSDSTARSMRPEPASPAAESRALHEARHEVALRLEEPNDLGPDSELAAARGRVLHLALDPEELRVLAADPRTNSSPSTTTLKLWFVMPPPSGSTSGPAPGQTRSTMSSTGADCAILDWRVAPVLSSATRSRSRSSPSTATRSCSQPDAPRRRRARPRAAGGDRRGRRVSRRGGHARARGGVRGSRPRPGGRSEASGSYRPTRPSTRTSSWRAGFSRVDSPHVDEDEDIFGRARAGCRCILAGGRRRLASRRARPLARSSAG